jgi:hypothetical protein
MVTRHAGGRPPLNRWEAAKDIDGFFEVSASSLTTIGKEILRRNEEGPEQYKLSHNVEKGTFYCLRIR